MKARINCNDIVSASLEPDSGAQYVQPFPCHTNRPECYGGVVFYFPSHINRSCLGESERSNPQTRKAGGCRTVSAPPGTGFTDSGQGNVKRKGPRRFHSGSSSCHHSAPARLRENFS